MAEKTYKVKMGGSFTEFVKRFAGGHSLVVRAEAGEVAHISADDYHGLMRKKAQTGVTHVPDDTPADVDVVAMVEQARAQIKAEGLEVSVPRMRGSLAKFMGSEPTGGTPSESTTKKPTPAPEVK